MKSPLSLNRRALFRLGLSPLPLAAARPDRSDGPARIAAEVVARALAARRQDVPAGTLRLAGPVQGPASLDPALSRDLATNQLVRQVFRGLMQFDTALNAVPALADDVDLDPDGRRYRFRLRDDAAFHDGRPVVAVDVVASLSRALNPAIAGGDASQLASPTYLGDIVGADDVLAGRAVELAGARAVDERTVELELTAPRATFLMKLASVPAAIVDAQQTATDPEWWRTPNGTGPFRVAGWDPDQLLTLEAQPSYLGEPVTLQRVEIRLGQSANLPFNLYQADEIDVVESVPPESVARVRDPASAFSGTLQETPLFALGYIAFGNERAPFDDRELRRALRLAFPTGKIAEVSEGGMVDPATGVVPRGMLGRPWATDWTDPDLEAARQALAASRFGTAERVPALPIYCADPDLVEPLRDVIFEELGLSIEVVQVNWPDFLAGLGGRLFPAYAIYWGADYPDPESILWMLFGSDSPDNYTSYTNPELDALLGEAAALADAEARVPLYAAAQRALLDDGAVIPLFFDVGYTLVRPEVQGLEVTALGILGLEGVQVER